MNPRAALVRVLDDWHADRQMQLEALLDAGLALQPLRQDGTPITVADDTDGGTGGA